MDRAFRRDAKSLSSTPVSTLFDVSFDATRRGWDNRSVLCLEPVWGDNSRERKHLPVNWNHIRSHVKSAGVSHDGCTVV